jgi:hypothetical protein
MYFRRTSKTYKGKMKIFSEVKPRTIAMKFNKRQTIDVEWCPDALSKRGCGRGWRNEALRSPLKATCHVLPFIHRVGGGWTNIRNNKQMNRKG